MKIISLLVLMNVLFFSKSYADTTKSCTLFLEESVALSTEIKSEVPKHLSRVPLESLDQALISHGLRALSPFAKVILNIEKTNPFDVDDVESIRLNTKESSVLEDLQDLYQGQFDNAAFHLNQVDEKFLMAESFRAQIEYKARLDALEFYLRNQFEIMFIDVMYSGHMTSDGKYSAQASTHLQQEKERLSDALNRLRSNILIPNIQVTSVLQLRALKKQTLNQLKSDGHLLIEKLSWNHFKVDMKTLGELHAMWNLLAKGESTELKKIESQFNRRKEKYSSWPF